MAAASTVQSFVPPNTVFIDMNEVRAQLQHYEGLLGTIEATTKTMAGLSGAVYKQVDELIKVHEAAAPVIKQVETALGEIKTLVQANVATWKRKVEMPQQVKTDKAAIDLITSCMQKFQTAFSGFQALVAEHCPKRYPDQSFLTNMWHSYVTGPDHAEMIREYQKRNLQTAAAKK